MSNPQDTNKLQGANDVGQQPPAQVPTPDNGAAAANIDPLATNVADVKSTDDNVGTIGGDTPVGTDPSLVGQDTGTTDQQADDANAGTGADDSGVAGADSTDAGNTPAVGGDGSSVDPSDDSGTGSQGDPGSDSDQSGGTGAPDLTDLETLKAYLSSNGVSYMLTEKLATNELGFPLWIAQADFDELSAANPAVTALLGDQIEIASADFAGLVIDPDQDDAVLEVPNGDTSIADVVTWLNKSGLPFSVQQFTLDPAGTITVAASDLAIALSADPALQALVDGGFFIIEADQQSNDAGNAVNPLPSDSPEADDTGSTSDDDSGNDASGASTTTDASDTSVTGDQGGGDGTQGTTTPVAPGVPAADGGADAGSPASPDGTQAQPAGGTVAGDDSAGAGTDAPDSSESTSGDVGGQTGGSTPAPAPVVVTPPVAFPTTPGGDAGRKITDGTINQLIQHLLQGVSKESRAVIEEIYTFIGKMRPGRPLTMEEGGRNHQQLWSTLRRLFNSPDVDFHKTMPAVLKLIETHSGEGTGAFGMRHRLRYLDHARSMDGESRTTYQHMLHMLITLAPVRGRKQALQQTDLKKSVGNPKYIGEAGQQKARAYFEQQR